MAALQGPGFGGRLQLSTSTSDGGAKNEELLKETFSSQDEIRLISFFRFFSETNRHPLNLNFTFCTRNVKRDISTVGG